MAFTLGLALFGGGLATALHAYLSASAGQTRAIRTRIALESAAATVLGELAAGGRLAPERGVTVGGGRQQILISAPGAKVDLAMDPPDRVRKAARAAGLDLDPGFAATARGLADVSARHRLDATQEDCLRRSFTYGRGGAPATGPDHLEGRVPGAGDQVDLRVQDLAQPGVVLWLRVRFTGSAAGWRVHDYRRLQGVTACP